MKNVYADVALKNITEALSLLESINNIKDFDKLRTDVITNVHNTVHSIIDWYDRVDRVIFESSELELFDAIRYLNNQIKHDKSLMIVYYEADSSILPAKLPCILGATAPSIRFSCFQDNGRQNSRGSRNQYEEELMDKDVYDVFSKAKRKIIDKNM